MIAQKGSVLDVKIREIPSNEESTMSSMENEAEKQAVIYVEDTSILDEYLGYDEVSCEEIYENIDSNKNLNIEFNLCSKELVRRIRKRHPNYDLRIFNENIKTLITEKLSEEEYNKKYPNLGQAHYNFNDNRISFIDTCNLSTIYHELFHSTWNFCWRIDGVVLMRKTTVSSYQEAMDNVTLSTCFLNPNGSYENEERILKYLWSFYPDFSIDEYSRRGLNCLLRLLEEEFGKDLIDRINKEISVYTKNDLVEDIDLDSLYSESFIADLFSLACMRVKNDPSAKYMPFYHFAKAIPCDEGVLSKFLEDYNEFLSSLGVETTSYQDLENLTLDWQDIYYFKAIGEQIVPYAFGKKISEDTIQSEKCHIKEFREYDELDSELFSSTFSLGLNSDKTWNFYLKLTLLIHPELYHQKELVNRVILDNNLASPKEFLPIKIMDKGTLVHAGLINNLVLRVGINSLNKRAIKINDTQKHVEIFHNVSKAEEIKNLSQYIPLATLLNMFPSKTSDLSIELEDLFSAANLYNVLKRYSNESVYIYKKGVNFDRQYSVNIGCNSYDLNRVFFSYADANICDMEGNVLLHLDILPTQSDDTQVSLYEILYDIGYFEEDYSIEESINLTSEELTSYVNTYLCEKEPKVAILHPRGYY